MGFDSPLGFSWSNAYRRATITNVRDDNGTKIADLEISTLDQEGVEASRVKLRKVLNAFEREEPYFARRLARYPQLKLRKNHWIR